MLSVAEDISLNAQEIIFVRTEGFANGNVTIRKFVVDCAGFGIAGGAAHVQRFIQLLCSSLS